MHLHTQPYVTSKAAPKAPEPRPRYLLTFMDAPAKHAHLLDRKLRFYTKADALRAMHHYEFEFDAYGEVSEVKERE